MRAADIVSLVIVAFSIAIFGYYVHIMVQGFNDYKTAMSITPQMNACPDYYLQDASTKNCIASDHVWGRNLPTSCLSFNPTSMKNSDKCSKIKSCGITWDGLSC
jgi:hypothetical protein